MQNGLNLKILQGEKIRFENSAMEWVSFSPYLLYLCAYGAFWGVAIQREGNLLEAGGGRMGFAAFLLSWMGADGVCEELLTFSRGCFSTWSTWRFLLGCAELCCYHKAIKGILQLITGCNFHFPPRPLPEPRMIYVAGAELCVLWAVYSQFPIASPGVGLHKWSFVVLTCLLFFWPGIKQWNSFCLRLPGLGLRTGSGSSLKAVPLLGDQAQWNCIFHKAKAKTQSPGWTRLLQVMQFTVLVWFFF